jgi:class 3 adenylate cyclase
MRCSACDHENRPQAKFCAGCGAPLARRCASCSAELPVAARFCDSCGARVEAAAPATAPARAPGAYTPQHLAEKILTNRSALEGERKQVTVLFADVAGFTALSTRLDPEDLHAVMDGCFRHVMEAVHRYEGTVNQFTGDGVMALFGAPIAHEDHAARAVAASSAIQKALAAYGAELRRTRAVEFGLRIGLNTGPVVVGKIGDDLRMDYTAQGHVVGLAARVQQLAPPGGITVTEQTARLAAGFFDFLDRGEQRLKGASVPVRVFELRGPGQIRSRLESSRVRGFSRFVGRDRELARLETALRQSQSGQPTVVLVTAEPGAGKSRLCHELVERAHGVAVHHARALSHGRMLPFHAIVELARGLFGVDQDASAADIRSAVGRGLAGLRTIQLHGLVVGGETPLLAVQRLELPFAALWGGGTVIVEAPRVEMYRGGPRDNVPFAPEDVCVAELLKKAGYATAIFG